MAMLAGPRRKQKVINLRAKNNEWSNDSSKFGQRMLEKMGWSSGKGLGANENGIVEHVVARYKNDEKGLGFEDKNDQWTKHEDDFNSLLANLSNGVTNDKKLHSGISLEVKSKKSKARVHYQKFTRGKDISRYSEKDLANIFGKKTFENQEPFAEITKEDVKIPEQVFTEKGSMDDYFKNKLAAFKAKNKSYQENNQINTDYDDEADFAFKGFSGAVDSEATSQQGFGFQPFTSHSASATDDTSNKETEQAVDDSHRKKKKKDKKKKKLNNLEIEADCDANNTLESPEIPEENLPIEKVKKSKNKKHLDNEVVVASESVEDVPQKKKSKKKRKVHTSVIEDIGSIVEEQESVETEDNVPKKKKKRKHKET